MIIDKRKLADAIRSRRGERGVSQADLGSQLGYSQTRVSDLEQGYATPDADLYLKLCDWLGADPNDFRLEPVAA